MEFSQNGRPNVWTANESELASLATKEDAGTTTESDNMDQQENNERINNATPTATDPGFHGASDFKPRHIDTISEEQEEQKQQIQEQGQEREQNQQIQVKGTVHVPNPKPNLRPKKRAGPSNKSKE